MGKNNNLLPPEDYNVLKNNRVLKYQKIDINFILEEQSKQSVEPWKTRV